LASSIQLHLDHGFALGVKRTRGFIQQNNLDAILVQFKKTQ
jgi:hypothetical protein